MASPSLKALAVAALCASLAAWSSIARGTQPDPVVRAAQEALSAQGYDPGPADGLMGRRTRGAITAFQRDTGLTPTGKLDPATRERLLQPRSSPPEPAPAAPVPRPQAAPPAPETPVEAAGSSDSADDAAASGSGNNVADDTPDSGQTAARPPTGPEDPPLAYRRLGWMGPGSGSEVARRHADEDNSPIRARNTGTLVVPDAREVYLLRQGERIEGFDCEPAAGKLHVDMAMGLDGPVTFTSLGGYGFCQLGFGIVLQEGQRLEFEEAWWGDRRIRGGTVKVGPDALQYVEP